MKVHRKYMISKYGRLYIESTAPHDVPMDKAPIIGLGIGAFLYVLYVGLCIKVFFLRRRTSSQRNMLVTIALAALFFFTTAALALNIENVVEAFIINSYDAVAYFMRPENYVFTFETGCLIVVNLIATCLLIWRLYVIWAGNKYIIVFPIITECASLAMGFTTAVYQFLVGRDPFRLMAPALNTMTAYLVLILWQYVTITGLIIGRIWWRQRQISETRKETKRLVRNVIELMFESGVIASMVSIVMSIFWIKGYVGVVYILVSIFPPVLAAVPTLIVHQMNATALAPPPASIRVTTHTAVSSGVPAFAHMASLDGSILATQIRTVRSVHRNEEKSRRPGHIQSIDLPPMEEGSDSTPSMGSIPNKRHSWELGTIEEKGDGLPGHVLEDQSYQEQDKARPDDLEDARVTSFKAQRRSFTDTESYRSGDTK